MSHSPQKMISLLKRAARTLGLGVTSATRLERLECSEDQVHALFELVAEASGIGGLSKAQLKQDLFVLLQTGFKRNGFFVEFGATNGVSLSNTYLLETNFAWTGILAEPATCWHADLHKNRRAAIDMDCVWSDTGQTLEFKMTDSAELSTLSAFTSRDQHAAARTSGTTYPVRTVSLLDLLKRHNAPKQIDYLSIDTEGSELAILSAFDFRQYRIGIITCVHNFTSDRQNIHELLTSNGYIRKLSGISRWDDWYVLQP